MKRRSPDEQSQEVDCLPGLCRAPDRSVVSLAEGERTGFPRVPAGAHVLLDPGAARVCGRVGLPRLFHPASRSGRGRGGLSAQPEKGGALMNPTIVYAGVALYTLVCFAIGLWGFGKARRPTMEDFFL